MDGAEQILETISKLLNLGVPVAMLIVIVWLIIKFMPALISSFKTLGDNINLNTTATEGLKMAFDRQVDKMSLVTVQLSDVLKTLGEVELNQVKKNEFDKMCELVYEVHTKINYIYENMRGGNNEQ